VIQKESEPTQRDSAPQLTAELGLQQQTHMKPFMVMETEDVSSLIQPAVDESSLASGHSAYVNVSQSDDDSQQPTTDRG